MKKDKEWLMKQVESILYGIELRGQVATTSEGSSIYYAIEKKVDELDEPQKPVIPQFVAGYIEKWEHESLTIYEWFTFDNNDGDEDVNKWLYNNTIQENRRREYLLIDAIRNGYEVEKEKLYHVVNKENYFMLRKYDGLVDTMQLSPTMSRDEFGKDTRFMLTEKEIKDYDERFWAFAEPV